jgi:excisionase family DNA binding protein
MKERKLYTIDETRELLGGISRTTIYLLIGRRKLASVEIGRRRFISAEAISDFIDASASITASPDKPARPGNGPRQGEHRRESVGLRGLRERSGR